MSQNWEIYVPKKQKMSQDWDIYVSELRHFMSHIDI